MQEYQLRRYRQVKRRPTEYIEHSASTRRRRPKTRWLNVVTKNIMNSDLEETGLPSKEKWSDRSKKADRSPAQQNAKDPSQAYLLVVHPVHLCIVEGRGAYKRGAKFCPRLDEKADVECVLGTDSQRQCYLDSVLSTVLKIIDTDGPLPMRNLRPAKKNRTAAERFKETHEAEYEARSAISGDVIKRVHDHNSAYPKLKEELDKRKSTIKVNANKMANNCDVCGKPIVGLKKKGKTAATGAKKKRTYQKRCKENNSRHSTAKKITKKRPNRKQIIEIYNRSKMVAKEARDANNAAARARVANGAKAKTLDMDVDEDLVTIYSQRKSKSRSDVSLSTYRSYPSTEHEPMV